MNKTTKKTCIGYVSYFKIQQETIADLACRGCRGPIDLHQPDSGLPYRFLATCPECGLWYRIDVEPAEGLATVIQLPSVEDLEIRETNGHGPNGLA